LEDAPDTTALIASIGGGGLITGVGSAIKALMPEIKIFGVEPETAAPAALSFEIGSPQVFKGGKPPSLMALAVKACSLVCGNE
jgi:threonine dehydratase